MNAGLVLVSEKNGYYAGSLFGYAESVQNVSHCFYLNGTHKKVCGNNLEGKYSVETFYDELSADSDANPEAVPSAMLKTSAVVSDLNAFAAAQEGLFLSGWALNVNATDISFWDNDTLIVTFSSRGRASLCLKGGTRM